MVVLKNDERRQHSRVDFATTIQIQIEAEGKIVNLSGDSKDLSLHGVFARTDNKLPLGSKCSVTVCLTGTIEKIELLMKGAVVRDDVDGMGIKFDSMDVETYSHLKNIVQYNSIGE
jgi:c-di-GMP-binding flagellar brake protein YcgR